MPLITGQGYQTVPDISPLTQLIGQAVQQKRQTAKIEQDKQKKDAALKIQQAAKTAGAQALRVRGIKDFSTQRKEIAIMAQNAIKRGEDASGFTQALEIQNQDEFNLNLTRIATRAGNADKLIDQGLKQQKLAELPAEQQAFESLIANFSEKDKKKARQVKAGLKGRATGSAIQTISEEGTAEQIGETSAIIKQREKFGEMTGSSRAKAIDKGFTRLVKIDSGIKNLDKAIAALDSGASTGVMQNFSPSIKAASIELDQIQNTLALDVLNSATFGALSAEELKLVKETALPKKMRPPELRDWLVRRKAAEQKLKAYFQDQIDFLDTGGTVAGFLRKKRRDQGTAQQAPTTQTIETAPPQGAETYEQRKARLLK